MVIGTVRGLVTGLGRAGAGVLAHGVKESCGAG